MRFSYFVGFAASPPHHPLAGQLGPPPAPRTQGEGKAEPPECMNHESGGHREFTLLITFSCLGFELLLEAVQGQNQQQAEHFYDQKLAHVLFGRAIKLIHLLLKVSLIK